MIQLVDSTVGPTIGPTVLSFSLSLSLSLSFSLTLQVCWHKYNQWLALLCVSAMGLKTTVVLFCCAVVLLVEASPYIGTVRLLISHRMVQLIAFSISFHYEHFSAQVNKHRKCAKVTVIYQIKMF